MKRELIPDPMVERGRMEETLDKAPEYLDAALVLPGGALVSHFQRWEGKDLAFVKRLMCLTLCWTLLLIFDGLFPFYR